MEDSDNVNRSFFLQLNVSLSLCTDCEYFGNSWTGAKEIRFALRMTQLNRDKNAEI
jgi:hypothetical protein